MTNPCAWVELIDMLDEDEQVQCIMLGDWGGSYDRDQMPPDAKHQVMSPDEAKNYMQSWKFNTGFGIADTYAAYIWSNKYVYFVRNYDGSTNLSRIPRHPEYASEPYMPGGG